MSVSHQEAVEELVHTEAQHTDHSVGHMVEEQCVQKDLPVAPRERHLVVHEAQHKHQLVEQLEGKGKAALLYLMGTRVKLTAF